MKQNHFIKQLLVVILAIVGIMPIWGEDVTATWTATSGGLGTATSYNFKDDQQNQWTVTRSSVQSTGWQSNCIQLGKNGGAETVTFTTSAISGTIKSVAIECSSYSAKHTVTITVGSSTYKSATATASWTTIETITGTGSSTGTITITCTPGSSARAFYVKNIKVIYETGSTKTLPSLNTPAVKSGTPSANGVTLTSGVNATGGANVTEYGFVYSTSQTTPTTSDTKVAVATSQNLSTTNNFEQAISGLSAGTTYYVRAYAINSVGTGYSEAFNFTTLWAVTSASNNTELGTVSGTTTITASPKECVGYGSPAYSVSGGTATVNQDGNTFTVSNMSANVTVTINFAAKQVDHFVDNIQGNDPVDKCGDGYTVPSLTDGDKTSGDECQKAHYKFIGWSSTPIYTGAQTEPAGLLKAGDTHDATGATYYAVWAKEE